MALISTTKVVVAGVVWATQHPLHCPADDPNPKIAAAYQAMCNDAAIAKSKVATGFQVLKSKNQALHDAAAARIAARRG